MASNASKVSWARVIGNGVIAGLIGGIVLALFLVVALRAALGMSPTDVFTADAHYIHSQSPIIGLLALLAVSILWGIGYAYTAATRPQINTHPWLSGVTYGAIVWVLMQFVLMLGEVFPPITPMSFLIGIIADVVFFGIPVALMIRARG